MQKAETCQLKISKKLFFPTLALSVICACAVILARALPPHSLVYVGEIAFPYTDAFVILAAGIGGLGCGLLSFVILFLGEFLRIGGDLSLYSVSTYLILVLLSAFLAYCGWFGGWKKSALACAVLSVMLALMSLPETALATGGVSLFFRFAPDRVKTRMGSGWAYVPSERSGEIQKSALAVRITFFSLAEALILCFAAIFCVNYFSASAEETAFDMAYILSNWRENLRIGLTLMCTAVPVAYLFNVSIMKYVVYPINAMAFLMERYFSVSEQERVRALPNAPIPAHGLKAMSAPKLSVAKEASLTPRLPTL